MATSDDDAAERENSDLNTGPGPKLRTAREAQELTLEEIAAELRIGVPHLRALELGEYETLGPPVFAKGYLKQYGARLGLNIPELVGDYERTVGSQSIDIAPSRTITLHDQRQITVWVVAALVLALVSAVIWFWWWVGTERVELPALSTIDDGPAELEETVVRAQTQTPTQAAPAGQPPPAPVAAAQSDPETVPATDPANESETDLATASEPASAGGLTAIPESESEPYLGPELEIVFLADSWTEITAESGDRLFYDLGRAGTIATVPVDRDMTVFFGNAAGVALSIDGEPYEIPATARRRGDTAQWDLAAR